MGVVTVIYILIVFKFIYPFFVRYFGFPDIKTLYDNSIIIGLFLLSWLNNLGLEKSSVRKSIVVSKYKYMFFVLLVLVVLSSFLNDNQIFVLIKSIIDYYFPFLFLFLIITQAQLSKEQLKILIKLCYFLIALQIPVVLMQYFIGGYSSADSLDGTISSVELGGGTGVNGVLGAFLFSLCMSRILTTKVTPGYLLLGLMSFIPSIIGGSKFGLLLIPVMVVVLTFLPIWIVDGLDVKRITRTTVFIFLITIIIFGVFTYLVPKHKFADFINLDVFSDRNALMKYDSDPASQRIVGYIVLIKIIFKDWIEVLFGLGYGAATGSVAFGSMASRTVKAYFPYGSPDGVFIMLTIGVIGLAFMIIILLYGVGWIKKYLRIETCPFMKMNGYAFISITVACILSMPYTRVWDSQIGLTYWVLAGVLLNRYGTLVGKRG